MAKKKTVDVIGKLYSKMGRVSYLLTKSEANLQAATKAHQELRREAVAIANQIAQAEAKTGD